MVQLSDLTFDRMMARIGEMKPDDVFYPRYTFKNEEELKTVLAALDKAGVKTVGFSNKEPLNKTASTSDDDYFISYHQMNFAFNEEQAGWLAKNMHLIPKVETLDVSGCRIGDNGAAALLKALGKSNVTAFHMEETHVTTAVGSAFKESLPETKLKKLYAGNNYYMKDDACAELIGILPKTKIEVLNLAKGNVLNKSAAAFEKALPDCSLTVLNIRKAGFSPDGIVLFLNGVKNSKLIDLDLSQTHQLEQTAQTFTDALPDLPVKKLRYDVWHTYSDEFYDKAAESLRDPRCRIEQPFFGVDYVRPENAKKITEACDFLKSNAVYRLAVAQKAKANAAKDVPDGTGLVEALENGQIKQALSKHSPLTAKECVKENDKGVSLISAAARAENLDTLFSAAHWNNAKEYAAAWDQVPAEHRWQMDGKDGRPSFAKTKNEVMKKAVMTMLHKNNARA